MITRLEASNFRCLRRVAQPLGPLQVLIGPNASGKTSFIDALFFLGRFVGEGLERAIAERAVSFDDLTWGRTGEPVEIAVEARVPDDCAVWVGEPPSRWLRFEVRIGSDPKTGKLSVLRERLLHAFDEFEAAAGGDPQTLFLPRKAYTEEVFDRGTVNWISLAAEIEVEKEQEYLRDSSFWTHPDRSALASLPGDEGAFSLGLWLRALLAERLFRVSLDSRALRQPSSPLKRNRRQPDGSDLPWRVQELARQPERFQQWLDHLRTALPDLDSVRIVERPEDRSAFLMARTREGLEVPSWTLSDGTLRLMALTLIAYLPEPGDVYFVEEPENGVHPGNLETIFESLSSVYEGQVLLETHSPLLLGLAEPEQILCFRRTPDGTEIVRGDEHPALKDWKREISLGSLFASGILAASGVPRRGNPPWRQRGSSSPSVSEARSGQAL